MSDLDRVPAEVHNLSPRHDRVRLKDNETGAEGGA
jgi:hypothetical protein